MVLPILNKASLLQQLHQHKRQLRSFGIKRLDLFGSFVKDLVGANSDVDLLVEFEEGKKSYDNFMDLSFYLESITGRKVELITPQSLNKYLGPYILKEAEHVF